MPRHDGPHGAFRGVARRTHSLEGQANKLLLLPLLLLLLLLLLRLSLLLLLLLLRLPLPLLLLLLLLDTDALTHPSLEMRRHGALCDTACSLFEFYMNPTRAMSTTVAPNTH